MFPYQQSCELSFQTSDVVDQDQTNNNNIEDLIVLDNNNAPMAGPSLGGMNLSQNINRGRGRARGRGRGRRSSPLATGSNANDDEYERKTIHREVERQRRQEMSNLYTSLRSTLPAEYIKGKRAISDHVGEAVNYIKDLEKNVKELEVKRDQLRRSQESNSSRHEVGGSSNFLPGSVEIRQFVGGLEIEISISCEDEEFSLSSALQLVFEEGVGVTSCSSTRISERLIHNLLCEVSDITCIDVNRLQQRLTELVC